MRNKPDTNGLISRSINSEMEGWGLLPGAQGRAWEVGTNVARDSVLQDDKCMAGSQPWECTSFY